jgi:hypothetical protein
MACTFILPSRLPQFLDFFFLVPSETTLPILSSFSLFDRSFLILTNSFPRSHRPPPHLQTPQGHTKLPDYVSVGQFTRTPLRDLFTAASGDALNLLSKCIIYEPRRRISARDVRIIFFISFIHH